jgi:hypothetical protein
MQVFIVWEVVQDNNYVKHLLVTIVQLVVHIQEDHHVLQDLHAPEEQRNQHL